MTMDETPTPQPLPEASAEVAPADPTPTADGLVGETTPPTTDGAAAETPAVDLAAPAEGAPPTPPTPPKRKRKKRRRRKRPKTLDKIQEIVDKRRVPWTRGRGIIVWSDFPRRDRDTTKPLLEKHLLALAGRIGETDERPLVQLRRLNDFFGGAWMLAQEVTAHTTTQKRFLFRKDGQPRSLGARYFRVCERSAWKSVSRRRLTQVGLLWMFDPTMVCTPEPRLRQIPTMPRKKKLEPPPKPAKEPRKKAKTVVAEAGAAPTPAPPVPIVPPKPTTKTPGIYRAVPPQQKPPPRVHGGRPPAPMPEVYTSVRRPRS